MSYVGTSTVASIEFIVGRLREIQPKSILDVGCGWGRQGFLAREFLELWAHRYTPDQWEVYIDALDAHPGTWNPIHEYIYNRIIEVDVREWTPDRDYDVAICCDVLEHMPKDESLSVLNGLRGYARNILIGMPLGTRWPLYEGYDGNPYGGHRSHWQTADFVGAVAIQVRETEDGLPYVLVHLRGQEG